MKINKVAKILTFKSIYNLPVQKRKHIKINLLYSSMDGPYVIIQQKRFHFNQLCHDICSSLDYPQVIEDG